MKNWRDYFENVLIAVFLALFVRTFILTGYKVPTSSMAPTLLPGDFIFFYRLPLELKFLSPRSSGPCVLLSGVTWSFSPTPSSRESVM